MNRLGKKKSEDLRKASRAIRANTFFCACTFTVGLLLFCTFLSVDTSRSHAATDDTSLVSTTTREGRLAVFDDVWETIQERYYDPAFPAFARNTKPTPFRPPTAQP